MTWLLGNKTHIYEPIFRECILEYFKCMLHTNTMEIVNIPKI